MTAGSDHVDVQWAIGGDVARHGGLALVQWAGPAARPRLVLAEPIFGSTAKTWSRRARDVVSRLAVPSGSGRAWVEGPPKVAVKGAFAGDTQGMATAGGIGRCIGRLEAHWYAVGPDVDLELVEQPDWVTVLGRRRVRSGKSKDGLHRVTEARLNLDDAQGLLARVEAERPTCLVDVAEACLIALACLFDARGLRAYADPLPSEKRRGARAPSRWAAP